MVEHTEEEVSPNKDLVTVFWREPESEPLRISVDEWTLKGGFLVLMTEDKVVAYPADLIYSVESMEDEGQDESFAGYREENSFREQVGTSPWFKAMKEAPGESSRK